MPQEELIETPPEPKAEWTDDKLLQAWFFGLLLLIPVVVVLERFDNTTELLPCQENVVQACLVAGGLFGLISGSFAIWKSKKLGVWQRTGLTFSFALEGFLLGFLLTSHASAMIVGLIDFPSDKTENYEANLLISRAYQTHGKGRSWNIQTTPLWSDLNITEQDYEFMLTHRRPGDTSQNRDEILSRGYFCAHVTLEKSGNAVRVMHAGSRKLPQGTVIICPPDSTSSY